VFVGHHEPDGREKYLEEVARNGIKLHLFGSEWDRVVKKSKYLRKNYPVRLAWDDEYNKALCGAKIALSFLSKLNRDTYTRRCFEIPATKTFMLSQYSKDLASMFKEGVEAEYFRDKDELIDKIGYYLNHSDKREEIALNGYNRVVNDGHDVISRMRYALKVIQGHMVKSS
jgi:spore maturation protein CgeB